MRQMDLERHYPLRRSRAPTDRPSRPLLHQDSLQLKKILLSSRQQRHQRRPRTRPLLTRNHHRRTSKPLNRAKMTGCPCSRNGPSLSGDRFFPNRMMKNLVNSGQRFLWYLWSDERNTQHELDKQCQPYRSQHLTNLTSAPDSLACLSWNGTGVIPPLLRALSDRHPLM